MKNLSTFSATVILLLFACSPKETPSAFIDYETVAKDDVFRAMIKTGNFIRLSDGYTYYEYNDQKSDTILVMVHGFSVPSYIWDSTYNAAVKRGYNALRYDTYGRGFSDNPDVAYDVALYTQQLKELLDGLNITRPVNLVGLSDGGRTISGFAYQFPEKIKNLIYVDPAGFEKMPDSLSNPATVTPEEILEFKKARYPTMASGQMGDFYDSIHFKGWDLKYKEMMKFNGFVRALISTGKNRTNLEIQHRKIAASGIPVYVFWGDHDTVVKLDEVKATMMERIPKTQLIVIPNAGHLPQMEQTQLFNSILFDQIIAGKPKK